MSDRAGWSSTSRCSVAPESDVRAALQACWDEYHELMPDDLHEQVKKVLGIREFEGKVGD